MLRTASMSRFPLFGLAFALAGCPSVLGADFDHPTADPAGDASDPAPATDNDAGIKTAPADASPAPECAFADCKVPEPSNVAAFGALPLGGSDLTVPASSMFDTSKDCNAGSILGECGPVTQAEGPAVCVCRSGSLAVGDLTVTGARGLVLLSHGTVTIRGTLDIAATHETGGPGAEPAPSTSAASGMFFHGTADLVPLRGGAAAIDGSQGGGALQISAGTSIVVKGTIQAGGGGGLTRSGFTSASGGSGGAILLEAPVVKIDGQLLANGGGGGGGGGQGATVGGTPYKFPGQDGQDARAALRERARGGIGANSSCDGPSTSGGGGGWGGIGGNERTAGQAASHVDCSGASYYLVQAGGAGGGVGRIRFNTSTQANLQFDPTSFVSPTASVGILTVN